MALKYVPPKLQTKELVLEAVKQEGWALRHAGKFRNDHDVAREAVSNNGRAIKFVHPRIRLAHPRNKRVRDIVMLATKNDGYAPLYAHSKCFDDPDIVLTATQNKPDTIRHASSKLLRKKEFILKLLEVAPKAFEHIPKRYLRGHLKDPDIVLAAIKQRGSSLEMVKGNPLWKKSDFCLKALANNKVSHRYVDKSLLEEESFVIKALKKSPYIYDLLPEKFKGRRDLALLSVQSGGPIPEKYAKDEEFLLAFIAVKGKPVMRMITRARPDLGPTNRAFILRALKTNGNLLRDLKGYQNDREAVLIAIRSRPEAIQYVSQELMQKPGFIEMAKRTSPEIINHLK